MPTWKRLFLEWISRRVDRLSLRARWRIGAFLAWLWWDVLRLRRFTVYRNLTIAFPEWSKLQRRTVAKESLIHLCMNFPEFLRLPQLNRGRIAHEVILEGWEKYEKAFAQKNGVLIMSLHLGNGDLGTATLSLLGPPVHLISKKFKNKNINNLWFGLRQTAGTKFIEPHGPRTAFEILAACRKNEAVIFVIDQFMGRPYGIESTFFGRKTGTAYGLALFAAKTGAPVIPVYAYRDETHQDHLVFEDPIPFQSEENRDLQMRNMTEKYNQKLEEIIRRHPEQWMWVHRRWKRWE